MTMSHVQATTTNPLGALLRRGRLWIGGGVLLGLLAAYVITGAEHRTYQSTAAVLVTATGVKDQSTLANSRTSGVINLDTEAQLAKSTAVAQRVQQLDPARRSATVEELLSKLSLTVPPNTEVLQFTYSAGSPDVSEQTANDFARAYLDERQATAQAQLATQIDKVSASVSSLNNNLKSVSDQLAALPDNSKQRDYAQAQRTLLLSQITSLTTQLNQLNSTAISAGELVRQATVPSAPSSPSLTLNLAAGLACGLLAGLLLAWLAFARARHLRQPNDVVRLINLPIAGSISSMRPGIIEPEDTAAFQDYRRLLGLIGTTVGWNGVVLLVSPTDRAPTRTVAANLASAAAYGGASVSVLYDADDGVFSHLSDRACVLASYRDGLPNGQLVNVDALRGDGLLIIATPPPSQSADAVTAAGIVDAVLVVLPVLTSVSASRTAVRELDRIGAPILGAVLVPTVSRRPPRQARAPRRGLVDHGFRRPSRSTTAASSAAGQESSRSGPGEPIATGGRKRRTGAAGTSDEAPTQPESVTPPGTTPAKERAAGRTGDGATSATVTEPPLPPVQELPV